MPSARLIWNPAASRGEKEKKSGLGFRSWGLGFNVQTLGFIGLRL